MFGLLFTKKDVANEKLKLLKLVCEIMERQQERWPLLCDKLWEERKLSPSRWKDEAQEKVLYSGMGSGGRNACIVICNKIQEAIDKVDISTLEEYVSFLKNEIKNK